MICGIKNCGIKNVICDDFEEVWVLFLRNSIPKLKNGTLEEEEKKGRAKLAYRKGYGEDDAVSEGEDEAD